MSIIDKFDFFLFDWDGCLADTTQSWVSAYFSVLQKRGHDITVSELQQKAWGNHEQGPKNLGIVDYQECWNEVVSLAEKDLKNPPLHRHVRFLLRELKKKNNKIGLVTSSYKNVITAAMDNHKIDHFFDVIVTKDDVKNSKPHQEALEKAIGILSAIKDRTIMIGDAGTDVLAGKNAGVKTALIMHQIDKKYQNFEELKQSDPDYFFSDFSEIYK